VHRRTNTANLRAVRRLARSRRLSVRHVHRLGEKPFLDYSGKKPRICDPETGAVTDVELFVGVLGASNYTFAEATLSQTVPDFCASTVRALEYSFGSAPLFIPAIG
jgi:transposase